MQGKKLLVADDSLTIQKVIRLALSSEGYTIQAVNDGNDALQQIAVFQPDVILIDVSLPGKTAFEVKKTIDAFEKTKPMRFVLMSSAFEKVDETKVQELKFHGRLTKPFDPAHLRQIITEVLHIQLEPIVAPPPSAAEIEPFAKPKTAIKPETKKSKEPIEISEEDPWKNDPLLKPLPQFLTKPVSTSETINPPETNMAQSYPPPHTTNPMDDWTQPITPIPDEPSLGLSPPPASQESIVTDQNTTPAPHEHDSDIRHLTESTIRMSGLDDYQWSVNEPSLKPPASITDLGNATYGAAESNSSHSSAAPKDPLAGFTTPFHFQDEDGKTNPLIRAMKEAGQITPPPPPPPELPPAANFFSEIFSQPSYNPAAPLTAPSSSGLATPAAFPSLPTPEAPAMKPEQLEEIVRKQLQELLEKMAPQLLPEIAERVIRAEIHRMLSEKP